MFKVLALAWCFSINGDVSMVLRREGVFARMVIEHDLREITGNPDAALDEEQGAVIQKIVNFNQDSSELSTDASTLSVSPSPKGGTNLFLWGYRD